MNHHVDATESKAFDHFDLISQKYFMSFRMRETDLKGQIHV